MNNWNSILPNEIKKNYFENKSIKKDEMKNIK